MEIRDRPTTKGSFPKPKGSRTRRRFAPRRKKTERLLQKKKKKEITNSKSISKATVDSWTMLLNVRPMGRRPGRRIVPIPR
ncbi:hypothetical protein V1478_008772 [Vespula squamosa]|uniref:Uncharacterized protein n=1 Tax=Vespula squamosa TaxID=30214 RepID=A0ABD2AUG6_VESSQ